MSVVNNSNDNEQQMQIVSLQLKSAEAKEKSLLQTLHAYQTQLEGAKNRLLSASSMLLARCTMQAPPPGDLNLRASHSQRLITNEAHEISQMESNIQQMKECLSDLIISKNDLIDDIKLRRRGYDKSEGSALVFNQTDELKRLESQEESLKEECRQLRKQLAVQRQKQWHAKAASVTPVPTTGLIQHHSQCHSQPIRGSGSTTSTARSPTASSHCQASTAIIYKSRQLQSTQYGSKAKSRLTSPNQKQRKISQYISTKQPNQQKFKFKPASQIKIHNRAEIQARSTETSTKPAMLKWPEDTTIETYQKSKLTVVEDDDEQSCIPDISQSSYGESDAESCMRPAIGASRLSTSFSHSPLNHNKSMESIEARKEANDRHFMFLTNF